MSRASTQLDLVLGIDIHIELVPMPAPTPIPFPHPFIGLIEFSPSGALLSMGITAAMHAMFGSTQKGPVIINNFPATKTGDEAHNRKILPHFIIPPGTKWAMGKPEGDAIMVQGSKTVYWEGSNACRLGSLAMSCSDPVRLPTSAILTIPKGRPVIVGGPNAMDWTTAAKALILRNKWAAKYLHGLVDRLAPKRLRGLLHWGVCQLTGHPVDVATGRLLTRALDFELPGPIPIKFERYYSSAWAERNSTLGYGWSHTFDERIWLERGKVIYKTGDGREIEFHTFDLPNRRMRPGQEIFYPIDRLTLCCKGDGKWEIRTPDGLIREFEPLGDSRDYRTNASKGDKAARVDMRMSRLTKIKNRLGQWVSLEYYLHEVDMVRTSEGRWMRLEHLHGKLVRVALPLAVGGDDSAWYNRIEFEYDDKGDLVKTTDSQKKSRTYQYEKHLLIEETDRDDVSFYFQYDGRDSNARCIRTWGDDKKGQGRLYFREITYDLKNRRTFVEDSVGKVTFYEMNVANAVEKITDPHGAATVTEYNDHLWKLSETDALGNVTRFEYDARGNETKRILPNGATYEMAYTAAGQIARMRDPVGLQWSWWYDQQGRLTDARDSTERWVHLEYEGPYATRVKRPDGAWVRLERDAFGAVTKVVQPDGSTEERWYDRLGQLVNVRGRAGQVWRIDYDLEGRPIAYVYPDETFRRLAYSGEGDVTYIRTPTENIRLAYCGYHQVQSREVNRSGRKVQFGYDSEDRLVVVINEAGEKYWYNLDACGRVQDEISFEGYERSYARDKLGRVTMAFPPDGHMVKMEYDVLGNVTQVKYPDGEQISYTYDPVGRMTSATNASGTVHFDRDQAGRVVRERFGDDWITTTYDPMSQPQDVMSSQGLFQRAAHTATGDLQGLGIWEKRADNQLHPRWGMGIGRDQSGLEMTRTMSGGVTSWWARDVMGRPTAQTVAVKGATVDWTAYDWTGFDRLTRKRDADSDVHYQHDEHGRLAASLHEDNAGRKKVVWRNPGPRGELYRTQERRDRSYMRGGMLLRSDALTYTYDYNGNLWSRELPGGKKWTYAWSASGHLKSVQNPDGSKVEFEYDALGRRIRKTSKEGTTRWMWNGNVPVHEWRKGSDGKDIVTTWVFEPGTFIPVAKLTSDGRKHSILTDYLGTPKEMRDEAGYLAWRAQLDIYGVAIVEEGKKEDCPWRWQGQYEDVETGLYYNRFRYYDPARGDYISQDPIRLLGGIRLYGYVPDPLVQIDVLGLSGDCTKKDDGVTNPVPNRMARVIDARFAGGDRLGAPGAPEAWVTAAEDLAGITTSEGLAKRLALVNGEGKLIPGARAVIEFDAVTEGLASPVLRTAPGFVGGGLTGGGAREFVIPNLPINQLQNVTTRIVP